MYNKGQKNVLIYLFAFICPLFIANSVVGQAIGGNAVFNFITLSPSAKSTALGGINISHMDPDLGMAFHQPAFLNRNMDGQIHLSVKPYLASINQFNFNGAHFFKRPNTTIGWGVQYMDYGTLPMTDIAGNELGSFRPNEYALQMSASTTYQQQFRVGASLKFIQSNYGIFHSNGIAADIGVIYVPYSGLTQWAILVNNIGVQLTPFKQKENLPFNITAGVSKQLANAPFQFSITAQRLSVWDNAYNDPIYNSLEGFVAPNPYQNVFNHLVFATEIQIGPSVNLNVGYNFLRRFDLNIPNQINSLNGLSAGCAFQLNNMQIQYASAFFQQNLNHHFTMIYRFNKRY